MQKKKNGHINAINSSPVHANSFLFFVLLDGQVMFRRDTLRCSVSMLQSDGEIGEDIIYRIRGNNNKHQEDKCRRGIVFSTCSSLVPVLFWRELGN
jgi:hypothetical protein